MKIGPLLATLSLALTPASAQQVPGPAVGAKIPAFEARDQSGKAQRLATLTGPKGLYLLFVRSADW
jgi:hypothetical protein